jgi:quercetin 2,3-dioxygenase
MLPSTPVVGGFTSDRQPAGPVFYWSDTRFSHDFESGLHHHEGLEIVSFILNGSTSHYDGVSGQWVDLDAGDAEIIRSGSGIAHSELAAAGAPVLSIWFDPGYDAALRRRPSYADYPAASFTARPIGDALVTDLIGGAGPIQARTEGLCFRRITVSAGSSAELDIVPACFTLAYLTGGAATVNGAHAAHGDALSLSGANSMTVRATAPIDLLVVSVLIHPSRGPVRQR